MKQDVLNNREVFLKELRSGKYKKGCIKSDETTGKPIFDNEEDYNDNTACSCAIMGNLFGHQRNGNISLPKATKALGLNSKDCRFIQREINDRKSTLQEDAEIIETLFFNEEKLSKLKEKVDKYLANKFKEEVPIHNKATDIERIYIEKIIYDFKNSGRTIKI